MTEPLVISGTAIVALYALWLFLWLFQVNKTRGEWGFRFTGAPFALYFWDPATESGRAAFLWCEIWAVRGTR